jgi:hypothetical protein
MAEEKNPLQGNTGASKERIAELKQLNVEGAKAKAMLQGLAGAFKNFDGDVKSAIKSNEVLAGAAKNLSSGYKQNINLANQLSGATTSQLKDAKSRRAFENQVLKAQGEQASISAQIKILETEKIELAELGKTLEQQRSNAIQERLAKQHELATAESDANKVKVAQQQVINQLEQRSTTAYAKRAGVNDTIAKLQEDINEASKKGASFDKEKLLDLEKQLAAKKREKERVTSILNDIPAQKAAAEDAILDSQILVEEKQNELKAARLSYKAAVDLSKEVGNQQELTDKLVETNKAAADAIESGLDHATKLSDKIKEVNNAGSKLLKSFQNLSNAMLSNVPIIGGLFDSVFGELGKSQEMFEDAVAKGTSKAGARYKQLTGTIKALTLTGIAAFAKAAFEGAKTASEARKIVMQGLGGGAISAAESMKAVGAAAGALTIPIGEAAAMVGQMNDALGTSLGFTGKQLTTFGTLTKKMGVSGEAAAKLFKFSVKTGTSYKDMAANVAGTTEKLNAMNGTAVAPKAVFEEMGNASQTILRNMKSNPDALIKAAAGARAMGMEMNKIADAAESTLDFESSMAKEMEAELMLGKDLNLDKLRAAAATGDQVTMQEEMKRLVMENKDALDGNVLAQGKMADTLGISKEELNKMLNTTEDQAKMAEQDASRKKANAANEKKDAKELGQLQLKTFRSVASLSDRLAKMMESFQAGALAFLKSVKKAIQPILDIDFGKIMDTFKTDGFTAGVKDAFERIWPAVKETIKNLGSLVVDTVLESFKGGEGGLLSKGGILGKLLGAGILTGGALTVGFKGLSMLGNLFGKMRGKSPFFPMYVKMSEGLKIPGLSKLTKRFPKLGKILNPFKNMKFGNIFKNLKLGNPFKNLRLPKLQSIFSKIKLPNLTKIFSKIKLPNLTNIFKNLKLPKMPKLPGMSKVGGLLSKLNPLKLLKGKGGAKAAGAAANVASKVAVKTGAKMAARIGANALKAIPVVGQVAMIGMAAYDAFQGVKKTGEFFGKDQEDTTTGEKVSAGIGSAISGLTFGLLDAGKAARGIKAAGDFVADKAKAGWEGIKKGAAAFGGWVSSGWDSLKQGFTNIKDKASEIANTVREKVGDFANAVKDKAIAAKDAILDFAGGVKDKALAFASSVGEGISNFASAAGEKISNFANSVGEGISNFANTARDKAKAFAGAIGEKIGNIRGKIGEFLEANGGLIGGIKAAAAGLANKAKDWLGDKWKGLKDWWNGDSDKSKNAAPEIKEAEIKKVTTPLVNMSAQQSKELMGALNTALTKGAENTVKAVNTFGDNIQPFITESKVTAENQLKELKDMQKESDIQHRKEMAAAKVQIALLVKMADTKITEIKMDSYNVAKALNSNY